LYIRKQNGRENDKLEDFWNKNVESSFATLSQRIKAEGDNFSSISGAEQGVLLIFVASEAVRTLAHKRCVEEQVGGALDANAFADIMRNMIGTMIDAWRKDFPGFQFYSSQPYIGEHFITGDSPVIVRYTVDNSIWQPTKTPKLTITNLSEILKSPKYEFMVSLSPFIYVSIRGHGSLDEGLPPQRVEPNEVRSFNDLIRGQCRIFTLARDRESLEGQD
jgi:chemotaxis protein CheY-P-specific phosphatase CheC